jgi:glycosyltransferase involved in cell wall biosynthesis
MISVVTPSLGDIGKLRTLCLSLQRQKATPFELILCTTGVSIDIKKQLPKLPLEIRHFDSPEKCISHARNLGLKNAQGDLVLFLDDDCQLPYDSYLQDLYLAYLENPELCGGGFYLSQSEKLNFTSRFYNFFCNMWLHSRPQKENSAQLLLGGCAFYPRRILQNNDMYFSAFYKKAGEEYALNHSISKLGHQLQLQKRWSVYHAPDCNFRNLLQRAWVQGRSLDQRTSSPIWLSSQFVKFLIENPIGTLTYLPLLALYLSVGRIAHWTREREHKSL